MELAMIGLGKMGGNMTRRLLKGGHRVVIHDRDPQAMNALASAGAAAAPTLDEVARLLAPPGRCG